jgi:uncharacterized protein YutE (UPF0331/DUF86 family)
LTNAELVARKLVVLEEHLRRLRERRPADLATLRADALLQDGIAMSLMVALQEAMDIALHIASDEGWELATTYRDAFLVLARHNVVPEELARSLGEIAQLRNRIAHGYATVDVERVWTELPGGIASFDSYARAIAKRIAVQPV